MSKFIYLLLIIKAVSGENCNIGFDAQNLKGCSNEKRESGGVNFSYIPNNRSNGTVYIIGDVNTVLQGKLPQDTVDNYWDAEDLIGFGASAVGSLSGLGEGFYSNGLAHVRSTDNETEKYFQTIQGREFRTPFSVFVTQHMVPDGIVELDVGNENLTLFDFYTRVYEAVKTAPFCFSGCATFRQMDAIAVSKAPIYGEPLFGNVTEGYYTKPIFQIQNISARVFGCVANFSRVNNPDLLMKLGRALYVNPLDAGSATQLQVHSHSLSVKSCEKAKEEFGEVYHLLSNATLMFINARIFKIDSSDKLVEYEKNGSLKDSKILILFSAMVLLHVFYLLPYFNVEI